MSTPAEALADAMAVRTAYDASDLWDPWATADNLCIELIRDHGAALAEALRDAERYQHIVAAFPRTIYEQCGLGQPGPHDYITPEMVGAAIDAAIAAGGKQ